MRRVLVPSIVLIVVLSFFLIGCEKRSVQPHQTDWDAVKAIISDNPEVFSLGFYDTAPDTLFYREITQSIGDIDTGRYVQTPAEDLLHLDPFFPYIILVWGDSLKGTFHYRLNGKPYQKPISSKSRTNAYFEKWGDDYDPYLGWLFKQLSGTVINSDKTTRHPSTLNVVSEGVDVIITEPTLLKLVKRDSTLIFEKGRQVTFTIDPIDSTDFLFLHVKEGQTYQKIPFTSIGGGKFSASWTTTTDPEIAKGYHQAIVDLVSRQSVTDTTSKYDSKAWGVIYRIR
ncbi:MAG: hypothetical protein WCE90_00620 [Candidatus Zixiibacteriota bacterium]